MALHINVRDFNQWKEKRKPDLKPYRSIDDERFKVRLTGLFWDGVMTICVLNVSSGWKKTF